MLVVVLASVFVGCPSTPPDEPEAPALALLPRTFAQLPGWAEGDDRLRPALEAFRRSCDAVQNRPPDALRVAGRPAFGRTRDWVPACEAAQAVPSAALDSTLRRFFETRFRPYRVVGDGDDEGLFTGYFEPQLHGARRPSARFSEPLHRRPPDLIRVDLKAFNPDLSETLYGTVDGQRLVPYASRKAIDNGALAGRGLELAWVDDPVDKFFLQIQGSGRVLLPDSTVLRVGYDGENGHPYRAIGRDLIEMGEVSREDMSMQAIRAWMAAHPDRRDDLMHRNPSYVFFRSLGTLPPGLGPLGAQGVPLTPGHSLAVDPRFIPYGAPLWLATRRPVHPPVVRDSVPGTAGTEEPANREAAREPGEEKNASTVAFRRLMIAQDTGGAIRGAVRGDVFWGAGDRARSIAGRMQHPGRYAVLLPVALDPVEPAPAATAGATVSSSSSSP